MTDIKCEVCSCIYCDCGNRKCKLDNIEVKSCKPGCKDKESTMCNSFKER